MITHVTAHRCPLWPWVSVGTTHCQNTTGWHLSTGVGGILSGAPSKAELRLIDALEAWPGGHAPTDGCTDAALARGLGKVRLMWPRNTTRNERRGTCQRLLGGALSLSSVAPTYARGRSERVGSLSSRLNGCAQRRSLASRRSGRARLANWRYGVARAGLLPQPWPHLQTAASAPRAFRCIFAQALAAQLGQEARDDRRCSARKSV